MRSLSAVVGGLVWVAVVAQVVVGQESHDVTIRTPFAPGERPTSATFYYDERLIGKDRDAFEIIIKRVAALPEGTSIVWGPDYSRCGACSGREPRCLPKHLFPDLWEQLEETVAARQLSLSSTYPGPSSTCPTRHTSLSGFPKQVFADPPENEAFNVRLDWQFGEKSRQNKQSEGVEFAAGRLHRFTMNNADKTSVKLDDFFAGLPKNSQLLVRLTFRKPIHAGDGETTALAEQIWQAWDRLFSHHVRAARLTMPPAIVVPSELVPLLKNQQTIEHLGIDWDNFHGRNTPHDEVLYFVNGEFVGRGDTGVDQILTRIEQRPAGTEVSLPRYELGGRATFENLGAEETERRNAAMIDLIPFQKRRLEFDSRIATQNAKLEFRRIMPGAEDGTVLGWGSTDHGAATIASFGRIIHHDEKPRPAAAQLSWTRYDANDRSRRKLETSACYTLNDAEIGEGVAGFAKALTQIEMLPEGSVVHIRVCIRTKGRFICPLIYDGQRHFERTGFEPYIGMLRWLVDVAEKRKLQIEWIPDEAKSCHDCQLNK